jgi:hypothetical protein
MTNPIEQEYLYLPEDFPILPTVNNYQGEDGGYIAIYSHNPTEEGYSVGGGIYAIGTTR